MPSEPTGFGFGDVLLVPFPFTDQKAVKRRPAVVISGSAYNREKPDVIIMAVTSQLRPNASRGELWLQDWSDAGLLKPSAVKPVSLRSNNGWSFARSAGWRPVTRRTCTTP